MSRLLIVEDDREFARQMERSLPREGFTLEIASNPEAALALARSGRFEVALVDLYLGPATAMEVIPILRKVDPHLPVVVMTSRHTSEMAIQSSKSGAYDYFPKPNVEDYRPSASGKWRWVEELSSILEAAAESYRLMRRVPLPWDTKVDADGGDQMRGKSRAMREVFKAIGRAAGTDLTVLIRGETGTGKELVARALYSHGSRSEGPFIIVNSAAIPETLLESELFGHEKGAFTDAQHRRIGRFEQAEGGTIFLDEIGEISFGLQQKLLRVLEQKTIERVGGRETIPVNARVIAATSRDLEAAVNEGTFRQDLYFRLNVAVVSLPPLRDRRDDIPDLIEYFWAKYAPEFGCPSRPPQDQETISLLMQQPWPGNVRQLRNVVRKLLLLSRGLPTTSQSVREALAQMEPIQPAEDQSFAEFVKQLLTRARNGDLENLKERLDETVEQELYGQAIGLAGGDQSRAARWLGVSRPTMLEKLRKFNMRPEKTGSDGV
jgi:DNA-binding NtrC family response regulator